MKYAMNAIESENYDAERFAKNNEAVSKLLLQSETGHTAEYYRNQVFSTMSPILEDFKKNDEARARIFTKESFQKTRKKMWPSVPEQE